MLTCGYNLSSGHTVQQAPLGSHHEVKGATYMYCKASAAIAQYAVAQIAANGTAAEMTTTTAGSRPACVVIPQFAVAQDEYFWAPVGPFKLREDGSTPFYVLCEDAAVVDAKLYTTGTAGKIDDDSSGTVLISGLLLSVAATAEQTRACIAVRRLNIND